MQMVKSNSPKFKTFGEGLKHHRLRNDLSLRDLATRCGLSQTYIHYLERDFSPNAKTGIIQPSLEVVDKLARGLGWSQSEARILAGYAPKDAKPASEFAEYAINNIGAAKELSEEELNDIGEVVKGLIESKAKRARR